MRVGAPAKARRVLMVAHEFYPSAAIGCHRSGKFCKYLPQYGWEPVVLTARQMIEQTRFDPTLLRQLPAEMSIIRTFYPDEAEIKRWVGQAGSLLRRGRAGGNGSPRSATVGGARMGISRWLSIPDWAIYWLPWAVGAGVSEARRADAIYATAPPHGSLVVAAVLARLTGRRLVLDLRDPWTLDRTLRYPTPRHRRLNERLERWCFETAAVVICNTPAATEAYRAAYRDLPRVRFVTLPNGFDRDDFPPEAVARPRAEDERLHLAYVGSLHGGRDPRPLLRAARRCMDAGWGSYRLHFWSGTPDIVRAYVDQSGAEGLVENHGPVPHRQALQAMLDSDVLLVFGASDTDELHVPGKLFEYVYCRRPILALVEPGAISRLIDDYQLGRWARASDDEALVTHLRELHAVARGGRAWPVRAEAFADFDRRLQAGRLAALLGGD